MTTPPRIPRLRAVALVELRVPRLTQNIDSLHQRAGSSAVVELHGTLARVRCLDEDVVVEDVVPAGDDGPPRCPRCGGLLRPDVVWFEALLPEAALHAAQAAEACDLFLAVGTSLVVEPAASLRDRALFHGASVAILNLDVIERATPLLYLLHGRAGELLPALVRAAWPDAEM